MVQTRSACASVNEIRATTALSLEAVERAMKIVSPFHEDYDALAYGTDPEPLYERVPRARLLPRDPWPYGADLLRLLDDNDLRVAVAFLLFCDRIFPLFGRDPMAPWALEANPTATDHGYSDLTDLIRAYRADLDSKSPSRREAAERFFANEPRRKFGHDWFLPERAVTEFAAPLAGAEGGDALLREINAPCAILAADPEGGPASRTSPPSPTPASRV